MSFFKKIIGDITILTFGDKVGHLFNNTVFNVSTSTFGVAFTGAGCARSIFKGIASPVPICKCLYFTSATLNWVSCVTSSISLLCGNSCLSRVPLLTGSLAYGTSISARACNSLAACMDPTSHLTGKAIDSCIDAATKNFS